MDEQVPVSEDPRELLEHADSSSWIDSYDRI